MYKMPRITPNPPDPLVAVPSLANKDIIPAIMRKNPAKKSQKLAKKLNASIFPNKPIPPIIAIRPSIKYATLPALLVLQTPKL